MRKPTEEQKLKQKIQQADKEYFEFRISRSTFIVCGVVATFLFYPVGIIIGVYLLSKGCKLAGACLLAVPIAIFLFVLLHGVDFSSALRFPVIFLVLWAMEFVIDFFRYR